MFGTAALVVAAILGSASDFVGSSFCASKANIGDAGIMRLANGDDICWRNAANDGNACVEINGDDRLIVPEFVRNTHIPIGAALQGATAPTAVTVGNHRCLQFNQAQTAETAHVVFIVMGDWVGDSDWELHFRVFAESGDAIADGEVIDFDITYNVLAPGDAYDAASTTVNAHYTQSGAGVDKGLVCVDAVIDYDDATNPLVKNSQVGVAIDLDEVNTTYSGNPILCQIHTKYYANTLQSKSE